MALTSLYRELEGSIDGELTDFQVLAEIDYREGMRSDFADVRFYDSEDNPLPFYLVWKEDGDYAVFVIKFSSIPESPDRITVRMDFGDNHYPSDSDPDAVYDFYDDFASGLDTDVWDVDEGLNYSVTDGVLKIWKNTPDSAGITLKSGYYDFSNDCSIDVVMKRGQAFLDGDCEGKYIGKNANVGLISGSTKSLIELYYSGDYYRRYAVSDGDSWDRSDPVSSDSDFHYFFNDVVVYDTTYHRPHRFNHDSGIGYEWQTEYQTWRSDKALKMSVACFEFYVDFIAVRKTTANPPEWQGVWGENPNVAEIEVNVAEAYAKMLNPLSFLEIVDVDSFGLANGRFVLPKIQIKRREDLLANIIIQAEGSSDLNAILCIEDFRSNLDALVGIAKSTFSDLGAIANIVPPSGEDMIKSQSNLDAEIQIAASCFSNCPASVIIGKGIFKIELLAEVVEDNIDPRYTYFVISEDYLEVDELDC